MTKRNASGEAPLSLEERRKLFVQGIEELQKEYGLVATNAVVVERVNDNYVVTKAVLNLIDATAPENS